MLARRLTLEESHLYDNLTQEFFDKLTADPEILDLQNVDVKYHTSKANHNENTHVKIRLLYRN